MALQDESVTLAKTRALFDKVILDFPNRLDGLGLKAATKEKIVFESTILRIQIINENNFYVIEKRSVKGLLLKRSMRADGQGNSNKPTYLTEKLSKQTQSSKVRMKREFMDLQFISGTPNVCKRLFSKNWLTFLDRCHWLLPSDLKRQKFNINCEYRGIAGVHKVLE